MKLNILMVQKQNLINLNWEPTQMVVEPIVLYKFYTHGLNYGFCVDKSDIIVTQLIWSRKIWLFLERKSRCHSNLF